ncbi:DUF2357 domain-containing protein [Acetatifactor muris]|uniref:DUF2357 domain-containing protein n=1 Tax=Acetatifactor muris TaxID=879566 RepID=UPI0023F4354B|nr:DUF2357 domain-containing protein [Acetatifactor muris]
MNRIENYEQYCRAFQSADDKTESDAALLLYVQNWIIRVLDFMEEDAMDFSLKKLLDANADKSSLRDSKEDALSEIVDETASAFRYIMDHMREKIVRENVRLPVYKVREMNGYGLNWLSRQSGRTIREKISSAGNSVMAVQRRMSLDTGENRLFVAFAGAIAELLQYKADNHVPCRDMERDYADMAAAFLHGSEIGEIRKWENLAPNNTLLSDQNYKKIWYGWNGIKKLDDRIKDDMEHIDTRLATIFFVELLTQARNRLRIPQMPVEADYDGYRIYTGAGKLYCLDHQCRELALWQEENCVCAESTGMEIRAVIVNKKLTISGGREAVSDTVTPGNLTEYVQRFLRETEVEIDGKPEDKSIREKEKYQDVIIDLFSLHPQYIGDGGQVRKMAGRMLQQSYSGTDMDGDCKQYYIPCDRTNALKMVRGVTETYTVPYAADHGSMEQMKRLLHMMENYISTENFTFVFPDAFHAFQLSMVHKAARMAYRKVKNIPQSVGAAFAYQKARAFAERFEAGAFLLVMNLADDEITFTLLRGSYDEGLEQEVPEYGGIVWERYPTAAVSCREEIRDKITDRLIKAGCAEGEKVYHLLGLEGICDETDRLSFFFGEGNWFEAGEEIRGRLMSVRINVTEEIAGFLRKHRLVVGASKVYVISLTLQLVNKGSQPTGYMTGEEVLQGCLELEQLQRRTEIPLWHDYLPDLAIKQMYGRFDLVKGAKVVPRFDRQQEIAVGNTFTLPRNQQEYHFKLVQNDNARRMQYEAVIKNPAFPLKEDTKCRLHMVYRYGAEDPYELTFVPLEPKKAGFVEAGVSWSQIREYPCMNLDSPEFPPCRSWEELKCYPGKDGRTINVYHELEEQYRLIKEGYETCDISGHAVNVDRKGNRYGEFPYEKAGRRISVLWHEREWEKGAERPEDIGVISFLMGERQREPERYRIRDLMWARTGSNLWFKNQRGAYQCIVWLDYKGEQRKIAVFSNQFDCPEDFHEGINDISFEVRELPDGKLSAVNVHDESGSGYVPPEKYYARKIHGGKTPPRFFINSYFSKWTRAFFANNRSLADRDCPQDFQRAFVSVVNDWTALFDEYNDKRDKCGIFTCLSLAAQNIGKAYYDIAFRVLEMYRFGEIDIPWEMGCALGDLSLEMERELLEGILEDVKEPVELIGILSNALWHNENFVYNADKELLLTNFQKAVDLTGTALRAGRNGRIRKTDIKGVKACLEYILGVLRLRKRNDPVINRNYLSLNNRKMQELYRYIETMIDSQTVIYSFLKLEISNKGPYSQICDLLYVLLVYITGQDAEGEIKISGIALDGGEEG